MRKLTCHQCGGKRDIPQCCGFPMRIHSGGLICVRCAHAIRKDDFIRIAPLCCGQPMSLKFNATTASLCQKAFAVSS
jgi:hypothetical protein